MNTVEWEEWEMIYHVLIWVHCLCHQSPAWLGGGRRGECDHWNEIWIGHLDLFVASLNTVSVIRAIQVVGEYIMSFISIPLIFAFLPLGRIHFLPICIRLSSVLSWLSKLFLHFSSNWSIYPHNPSARYLLKVTIYRPRRKSLKKTFNLIGFQWKTMQTK